MSKTHDVPLSQSLDDDEVEGFKAALDKKWECEHGLPYTDDCDACDAEWAWTKEMVEKNKVEQPEVVEGTVLEAVPDTPNAIFPEDLCDHGIPLGQGTSFGKCSKCDIECKNTQTMQGSSCWRVVDGENHRYRPLDDEWVRTTLNTGNTGTTYVSKPSCKHFMDEFKLEEGLVIYASADTDAPANWKREKEDVPDLGVYLYSGWLRDELSTTPGLEVPWGYKESWPMAHLEWMDYNVPDPKEWGLSAAKWVIEQIESGKRVETGCMGGHGRTGTFLACILAVQGIKPGEAIKRVRETYCKEAIENSKQADYVKWVYEQVHTKKWRQSKTERMKFDLERLSGWKESKTSKWTKPTESTTPPATSTSTEIVKVDKRPDEQAKLAEAVASAYLDIYDPDWTCDHGKHLQETCQKCYEDYGLDAMDLWH